MSSKLAAYRSTILEFSADPPLRVDLRRRLPASVAGRLRALGLGDAFAVLTAANPRGENVEEADDPQHRRAKVIENTRRQAALERAIRDEHVAVAFVDGTAPAGDYREHCIAFAGPRERALAIARQLEQLAFFWFDGESFWLVPGVADGEPERLPG